MGDARLDVPFWGQLDDKNIDDQLIRRIVRFRGCRYVPGSRRPTCKSKARDSLGFDEVLVAAAVPIIVGELRAATALITPFGHRLKARCASSPSATICRLGLHPLLARRSFGELTSDKRTWPVSDDMQRRKSAISDAVAVQPHDTSWSLESCC